ncbi:hypothetical protein KUTeg_019727 [Tegillarca granosa]|uniref:MORN repeat protein n=1 Tax=Tegillarca granosa TaxID=220873 RepID=A0ABQ9EFX9_TEGGR|nr:hypothetical protein KUTeg_019727 [Tegillarca granosa]
MLKVQRLHALTKLFGDKTNGTHLRNGSFKIDKNDFYEEKNNITHLRNGSFKINKNDFYGLKLPFIPGHNPQVRKRPIKLRDENVHPFPKGGCGHGVYVYENKYYRYEGEWKNGKKHGHGKLLMKDGSYYEGQFCEGEITGNGFRFFAPGQCKYTGQFFKGELHGKGKMVYNDGTIYEGDWINNRKHGFGVMTTLRNDYYEGGYKANRRHGDGKMNYSSYYYFFYYFIFSKISLKLFLAFRTKRFYKFNLASSFLLRKYRIKIRNFVCNIFKSNFFCVAIIVKSKFRNFNKNFTNTDIKNVKIYINILIYFIIFLKIKWSFMLTAEAHARGEIHSKYDYFDMDGLFDDDFFHGKGVMIHGSGFIYDGQWIRGMPSKIATKLVFVVEKTPMIVRQGRPFEIRIECRTEDDELVTGFKHFPPKDGSALFDMIEDVEDKPIKTPFDYDVVPYPLTDLMNINEDLQQAEEDEREDEMTLSKSQSQLTLNNEQTEIEDGDQVNSEDKEGDDKDNDKVDRFRKEKEKNLEEQYAKLGEYVLMVHDVTNPPFLGRRLEPAFLLLKLKRPLPNILFNIINILNIYLHIMFLRVYMSIFIVIHLLLPSVHKFNSGPDFKKKNKTSYFINDMENY